MRIYQWEYHSPFMETGSQNSTNLQNQPLQPLKILLSHHINTPSINIHLLHNLHSLHDLQSYQSINIQLQIFNNTRIFNNLHSAHTASTTYKAVRVSSVAYILNDLHNTANHHSLSSFFNRYITSVKIHVPPSSDRFIMSYYIQFPW